MEVRFRINAREFRNDIQEILGRKIRGITTDVELYDTISRILLKYIKAYLPVDTGALRDQAAGESSKSGYFREGYLGVSESHGIVWDAIEHRTLEFRHYADYVIRQSLGLSKGWNGDDIRDLMIENGDWDAFIQECMPYIIRAFRRR